MNQSNGFFMLPHNFWEVTRELSVAVKFFLIYLLAKDNYFGGNGEFFLTDEEIQQDLRVGRGSLQRWRRCLIKDTNKEGIKIIPFIEFKIGKYTGMATTYNIKRIKTILFIESNDKSVSKQSKKRIKIYQRAYHFDSKSVSKQDTNNIYYKDLKEDLKKEGDFSNPSLKPNQNLKNGLVREDLKNRAEPLLIDKGYSGTIQVLVDSGAAREEAVLAVDELMYGKV